MMQNLLERLIESGGMNLQKNGLDIERENMKRSLFKALRRILVPSGKFYARQGC
jgi:hypothetical protein